MKESIKNAFIENSGRFKWHILSAVLTSVFYITIDVAKKAGLEVRHEN